MIPSPVYVPDIVKPSAFQAVLSLVTGSFCPNMHKSVLSKGSKGPTPDPEALSLHGFFFSGTLPPTS